MRNEGDPGRDGPRRGTTRLQRAGSPSFSMCGTSRNRGTTKGGSSEEPPPRRESDQIELLGLGRPDLLGQRLGLLAARLTAGREDELAQTVRRRDVVHVDMVAGRQL